MHLVDELAETEEKGLLGRMVQIRFRVGGVGLLALLDDMDIMDGSIACFLHNA